MENYQKLISIRLNICWVNLIHLLFTVVIPFDFFYLEWHNINGKILFKYENGNLEKYSLKE